MKKYLLVLLLVIFIIPSIAFASWWNPFSWSWFGLFHNTNTTIQTPVVTSTSTTPKTNALTSSEYGLTLQIPPGATSDSNNNNLGNNFIDQSGAVSLDGIDIPSVRGTFTASVSTTIKNSATCDQFSESAHNDVSNPKTITTNGINYINVGRGSAAAGTEYDTETFHTYQNNFCYEFVFNTSYSGMSTDNPSNTDVENMQNTLLKGISFSTPIALPPQGKSAPSITSFTVASQVIGGTNTPISDNFIFSWKTQGVDYVKLSYPCPNNLDSSYNAGNPNCVGFGNNPPSSSTTQYSPNGSTDIFFDYKNWDKDQNTTLSPIPLTLTLEPFVNGVGYPNLSKTITITVSPS